MAAMEDVTEHVVAWMKETYPSLSPAQWKPTGKRVLVALNCDKAAFDEAVKEAFMGWGSVLRAFDAVMEKPTPICKSSSPSPSVVDAHIKRAQLAREFTRPYRGDYAPTQLAKFITECWTEFCLSHSTTHVFPYTTVVQSSGFGKSRLLFELATRAMEKKRTTDSMRVLYTCVRGTVKSNGFPVATPALREYLFPTCNAASMDNAEAGLVDRLCSLFDYATTNWHTVGDDWIDLFTEESSDASVHSTLSAFAETTPESHGVTRCDSLADRRIVVLVIDEARTLLESANGDALGWFRRLRRALATAYKKIRSKHGQYAGIFAILVDTNSKISDLMPPASMDSSGRGQDGRSTLFPPFVLTHTMDITFDSLITTARGLGTTDRLIFYQELLLDPTKHESSLISMGRPLWESCVERLGFEGVVALAADKLLRNLSPNEEKSLNEETLWGIASMLCRLGIRPFSTSPLAFRVVAEFMATLSYVSTSKDHFISTYASEPLLAFGAARVWYNSATDLDHHSVLHTKILPQLRKLMHQEVVDTCGVGELVARIVLLLAMDTIGVLDIDKLSVRCYAGKFYSAWDLLRVLQGGSMSVHDEFKKDVTAESAADMAAFETKWSEWEVGFCHFVQLTKEPDEECLWAMLARRAAGLFPRNFKGVDLVIPIFKGKQVSMIIVQVKNRVDGDPSYPDSASTATRPNMVFSGDAFNSKANDDVLRVYMSLRGFATPQRFFLRDSGVRRGTRRTKTVVDPVSCVLCMQGLDAWIVQPTNTGCRPVAFLSKEVVAELMKLLEPWWDPLKLVEADLPNKSATFGLTVEAIKREASRSLVEAVVESKWSRVQQFNDETRITEDSSRSSGDQVEAPPSRKAPGKRKAVAAVTDVKVKANKTRRANEDSEGDSSSSERFVQEPPPGRAQGKRKAVVGGKNSTAASRAKKPRSS